MTDQDTSQSGAEGATGGAGGENQGDTQPQNQSQSNDTQPEMVSRDAYEQIKKDLFKFKSEARDLRERISEAEKAKLKETENYKAYAETLEKERDEFRQKLQDFTSITLQDKKLSAVREAARKAGIREEALPDVELVDLDGVSVETTSTGRIMVDGADDFVKRLQKTRSHWFKSPTAPKVNGGGGAMPPAPGKISASDVIQAERQWKLGKISKEDYLAKYEEYKKAGK